MGDCDRSLRAARRQEQGRSGANRAPPIRVECHAGYRGEETPRRLRLGAGWLEIEEVVDRWLDPRHRYFKVRTDDGNTRMLRHDTELQRWELVPVPARPPGMTIRLSKRATEGGV